MISRAKNLAQDLPLRILLAEDNAISRKISLAMLSRLGYDADFVGNGLDAVHAVEKQSYDVVLMDVQMPEMDGIAATRRIRESVGTDKQPWIIAITANVTVEDFRACQAAGMDDFLGKPMRIDDLTDVLSRASSNKMRGNMSAIDGAEEILNPEKMDVLRDIGGLAEIAPQFVEEALSRAVAMKDAAKENRFDLLKLEAHTLKGASGVVGATRLALISARIEGEARKEAATELPVLLRELEDVVELTRTALLAEAERPTNPNERRVLFEDQDWT